MATAAPVRTHPLPAPAAAPMSRLRGLVAMTRPSQILLIVAVLLNGMLLGLWHAHPVRLETVSVALVLVMAAGSAVHLANEAADEATDLLTARTRYSGGSGALEASGLSPRVPLVAGLAMALAVTVATLIVSAAGVLTATATVLLLAGLAGGLAYSLPPVAAMRHGWGEPLNATLGGLLLPLFGVAVVADTIRAADALAFLPFFFVVLASVMATAWPDRAADAATGKRTLQVRRAPRALRAIAFGAAFAFIVSTLVSALAEAMPMALAGLMVTPALVIGAAGYTRVRSPLANVAAMVGMTLLTGAVLLLSLLADGGQA